MSIYKYRFLIARRFVQFGILFLYIGANAWGWSVLSGNLSSSILFGTIPLSDPYAVLQMIVSGAIISIDMIIGAGIILIFYALLGGRIFCSFVCPVNIITDIANWLRRYLHMDTLKKHYNISRVVRYWMIGISLVLSFILGVSAFEFVSPISIVSRSVIFGLGFGWMVVLMLLIFDLFILKNGWCGHLCPLGAFYSIVGRHGVLSVKYEHDKCTKCMDCKVICPENQVLHMVGRQDGIVSSGECINCGRCIEVCDDDALHFSITNFNKKGKQ